MGCTCSKGQKHHCRQSHCKGCAFAKLQTAVNDLHARPVLIAFQDPAGLPTSICERIRLRELKKTAREAGLLRLGAKRSSESEKRARLRELRSQPCGAKTRAGHPCQRKGLGRGGRCTNHGGASTGPRTAKGRQRIAEAQRRSEAWTSLTSSPGPALSPVSWTR